MAVVVTPPGANKKVCNVVEQKSGIAINYLAGGIRVTIIINVPIRGCHVKTFISYRLAHVCYNYLDRPEL